MRIAHAADLHLGCRRWLSTRPGDPAFAQLVHRADELALNALVEMCLTEEVQLLLCAGDVIDGWCRDYRVALRLQRQLLRLQEVGCEVVLLLGNHDVRSRYLKSLLLPGHARVIGLQGPESLDFARLGVTVHGWSAPPVAQLSESAPGYDVALYYPPALSDRCNLGLLHTSAEGRRGHEDYAPCSRRTLRERGYQYWALGHVHRREVIATEPWIVYSGNLQARGFREEGAKGVTLIQTRDDKINCVEHRVVDVLRFLTLEIPSAGVRHTDDVWSRAQAALDRLQDNATRPTVVRLVILGIEGASCMLQAAPSVRQRGLQALRRQCPGERIWLDEVRLQPTDDFYSWSLAA